MDFSVSLLQLIEQGELLWTSLSSPHLYSSKCLQSVRQPEEHRDRGWKNVAAPGKEEVAVLPFWLTTHTPTWALQPPAPCLPQLCCVWGCGAAPSQLRSGGSPLHCHAGLSAERVSTNLSVFVPSQ